jgi:hypothetical protein
MYIALDDVPQVAEIVEAAADVSAAPQFTADDKLIKQLRFYVTVISGDDDDALFIRAYSPTKELTRGRGSPPCSTTGYVRRWNMKRSSSTTALIASRGAST